MTTFNSRVIYQTYSYLRSEGFSVAESMGMCKVPRRVVNEALRRHVKEWVQEIPSSVSDREVVKLIYGDLSRQDAVHVEVWVGRVRAEKQDLRRKL